MSNNEPILSPDEFTQSAAQLLAVQPEIEIVDLGELSLDLRVRGRDVACDLGNFYTIYRHDPAQLQSVQEALVASLAELAPDRSEDDPAVLLDRIMPMIKPLSLLSTVREQQLPLLAYRPLVGDLMLTYVIDEGQSVVFVNEDHLQRWRVNETALHRRALGNLRRKPWQPHPGVIGAGKGALLIFNGRDGYDATRVILPELFADFAKLLPGQLVIGVPNRDFLIAFSDADARVFDQVRIQIETDARTQDHPVSDQLLTFRDGALALYTPPARPSVA